MRKEFDRRSFLGLAGAAGLPWTPSRDREVGTTRWTGSLDRRGAGSGPDPEWSRTFDRSDGDAALAAATGTDGFLFAGQTASQTADAWAVEVDASGDQRWARTYGGGAADWVSDAVATPDGYLLAGQTASSGNGQLDAWLLKLSADGSPEWKHPYGSPYDDRASGVTSVGDGYVFTGGTKSGGGDVDAWLLKVGPDGDELWNSVFGDDGTDWTFDLTRTADDGYLLAGETDSAGSGGRDAWVLKADADGNPQGNVTFGGSADDYARTIVPGVDDGYVFAGGTRSGSGGTNAWLVKLDADGSEVWSRTYGGGEDDRAVALGRLSDGYLLAGATDSNAQQGATDTWLLKVDTEGQVVWQDTYGAAGVDYANALATTVGDGVLVAGDTESGGGTSARLVKLPGETVSVAVENPRLVQLVENTRIDGTPNAETADDADIGDAPSSDGTPDPPLVEAKRTTTAFDVRTDAPGYRLQLPVEITVRREFSSGGPSENTFRVRPDPVNADGAILDRIDATDDLGSVVEETPDRYPVFESTDDLEAVAMDVAPLDFAVEGTSQRLTRTSGSGGDFSLASTPALNIGFVAVDNFGGRNRPYGQIGDDFTGNNEFPQNFSHLDLPQKDRQTAYRDAVEYGIDYASKVVPTDRINVYRHDIGDAVQAEAQPDTLVPFVPQVAGDMDAARSRLQSELDAGNVSTDSGGPPNGTLYSVGEGGGRFSPADLTIDEFDVTIGIVPFRYLNVTDGDPPPMQPFRNDNNNRVVSLTAGLHMGDPITGVTQPRQSAFVVAGASEWSRNTGESESTVIHEAGHHFIGDPFGGELAQRDSPLNDAAHARDEIVSTKFDISDGRFDADSVGRDVPSYMSYADSRTWADALTTQRLVESDGSFAPTPPEDVGEVLPDAPTLFASGAVTEDGIEFAALRERSSSYRALTREDGEGAEVKIKGSDGDVVATQRVPTRMVANTQRSRVGDDADPESRIVAENVLVGGIAYPEETSEIEITAAAPDGDGSVQMTVEPEDVTTPSGGETGSPTASPTATETPGGSGAGLGRNAVLIAGGALGVVGAGALGYGLYRYIGDDGDGGAGTDGLDGDPETTAGPSSSGSDASGEFPAADLDGPTVGDPDRPLSTDPDGTHTRERTRQRSSDPDQPPDSGPAGREPRDDRTRRPTGGRDESRRGGVDDPRGDEPDDHADADAGEQPADDTHRTARDDGRGGPADDPGERPASNRRDDPTSERGRHEADDGRAEPERGGDPDTARSGRERDPSRTEHDRPRADDHRRRDGSRRPERDEGGGRGEGGRAERDDGRRRGRADRPGRNDRREREGSGRPADRRDRSRSDVDREPGRSDPARGANERRDRDTDTSRGTDERRDGDTDTSRGTDERRDGDTDTSRGTDDDAGGRDTRRRGGVGQVCHHCGAAYGPRDQVCQECGADLPGR